MDSRACEIFALLSKPGTYSRDPSSLKAGVTCLLGPFYTHPARGRVFKIYSVLAPSIAHFCYGLRDG